MRVNLCASTRNVGKGYRRSSSGGIQIDGNEISEHQQHTAFEQSAILATGYIDQSRREVIAGMSTTFSRAMRYSTVV